MTVDLAALAARNNELWQSCVVKPDRQHAVASVASRIFLNAGEYRKVAMATGVPWVFVGMVHYREADLDFTKSIAQGDPWQTVSRHVPRGRGPFHSWYDAAIDALVRCPPFAAKWKDWTPGGLLTIGEAYNGFGYEEYHHENTPYNWGATNHEELGKYTVDGKYDPTAWDSQIGLAAILKSLIQQNQEAVASCLELTPNTQLTSVSASPSSAV